MLNGSMALRSGWTSSCDQTTTDGKALLIGWRLCTNRCLRQVLSPSPKHGSTCLVTQVYLIFGFFVSHLQQNKWLKSLIISPGDHLDCLSSCSEEEKLQHVLLFTSKCTLNGCSFLPVLFVCFIIDFHGNYAWHTEKMSATIFLFLFFS